MPTKKNNDLLIFGLSSFLAVAVWVGFGVYKSLNKPSPPKVSAQDLANLDPKLDTTVLDELEARKSYSEEGLDQLEREAGGSANSATGSGGF